MIKLSFSIMGIRQINLFAPDEGSMGFLLGVVFGDSINGKSITMQLFDLTEGSIIELPNSRFENAYLTKLGE
jgi:hypothetical protein